MFSFLIIFADWHQSFPSSLRRIDVSPSAFKRHSQLFDDMDETSYKVTSPFQIWRIWSKQIWDDPKQQCSALCFSFKGCIFLNQKSPIVFCKCQASPPSLWDMVIDWVCTQAKAKRKWIKILSPSLSRDAYQCLYLVSIFSKKKKNQATKKCEMFLLFSYLHAAGFHKYFYTEFVRN